MGKKHKHVSLSAIGLNSPGLVSKITTYIFEIGGNIIDVEEYCRRDLFSIFLIVDFSASTNSMDEITTTLKAIENETDLKVSVGIYKDEDIYHIDEKEFHVVTVLGVDQPGIIANVSTFFHRWNISIQNCRMIARGKFFSMEMVIDTNKMDVELRLSRKEAIGKMKDELKDLCAEINQSVVIQSENIYKRVKKLIVFDVESTLIQVSSLKNLLKTLEVKANLTESMFKFSGDHRGGMQSLIKHVRTLKGIHISELEKLSEILQLHPGTLELIRILKSMGFKIALLSSGFNLFIKRLFEAAGVDYAFSNTLKIDENGMFTGELEEPVITDITKNEILEFILNLENINREQVIAVGDGSTSSHFIENCGLSIAFKPDEPGVKTDGIFSSDQITHLLYCLGIPKTELDKYVKKDRG